jgi:hypothetical protein
MESESPEAWCWLLGAVCFLRDVRNQDVSKKVRVCPYACYSSSTAGLILIKFGISLHCKKLEDHAHFHKYLGRLGQVEYQTSVNVLGNTVGVLVWIARLESCF